MDDITTTLNGIDSASKLYVLLEVPKIPARSFFRVSDRRDSQKYEITDQYDKVYKDFLEVLKSENHTIRELTLVTENNVDGFLETTVMENSKMQVTGRKLKIRVEKFIFTSAKTPEANFLKFLKLFDQNLLKKLEINMPSIDSVLVDKIAKLPHFKNLKTMEMGPRVENLKIDKFLGPQKMKCRVGRLTARDIAKVTETYLTKPLGAYFKIFTDQPIELNEIFRVINYLPCPLPFTLTNGNEPDVRTQYYTISRDPDNSLQLLIKILKNEFKGILCRIDFNEDLNNVEY